MELEKIDDQQGLIFKLYKWHMQFNIFLDPSSRVTELKAKINKWDLIKLKSFCTAKESTNKMKR